MYNMSTLCVTEDFRSHKQENVCRTFVDGTNIIVHKLILYEIQSYEDLEQSLNSFSQCSFSEITCKRLSGANISCFVDVFDFLSSSVNWRTQNCK